MAVEIQRPFLALRKHCEAGFLESVFFWDQSQYMSSNDFPPKKQASDWLIYLVYQLEVCFFGGKPLELKSWLWSQQKLTLVPVAIVYFFRQRRANSEHAKFTLQKFSKKWLHIKTNWYYYLENFYPIIRLWEVKYSNICHQMCAIFIICKEELSRCRFFSKCSHYI